MAGSSTEGNASRSVRISWAPCKSNVKARTSVLNKTVCVATFVVTGRPGTVAEALPVGVVAPTGAVGTPAVVAAAFGSVAAAVGLVVAGGAPNRGGLP